MQEAVEMQAFCVPRLARQQGIVAAGGIRIATGLLMLERVGYVGVHGGYFIACWDTHQSSCRLPIEAQRSEKLAPGQDGPGCTGVCLDELFESLVVFGGQGL